VLRYRGWRWRDAGSADAPLRAGRCSAFAARPLTVAQLTAHLPAAVREELIDPLCVAALNTPASQASATVFLRVLKDALFSGPGSADLLLPRQRLSALWPQPAANWLTAAGATVHLSTRADSLERVNNAWQVNGEAADAVVLACTANEAARLTAADRSRLVAPSSSAPLRTHRHGLPAQPGSRLPQPMLALHSDASRPAQFAFDRGAISGLDGVIALVVSGAAAWVAQGTGAVTQAALAQARQAFGGGLPGPLSVLRTTTEKRATFLCTPQLQRPASRVLPALFAAGDYVDGPYPATLEGAVRSGIAAASAIH
jgi:hypothetical protein